MSNTTVEITFNESLDLGVFKVGMFEYRTGSQGTGSATTFYAGACHLDVPLPVAACSTVFLVITILGASLVLIGFIRGRITQRRDVGGGYL